MVDPPPAPSILQRVGAVWGWRGVRTVGGRFEGRVGSVWSRLGADLGSLRGRSGMDLGSMLGAIWELQRVDLRSFGGRSGVDLGLLSGLFAWSRCGLSVFGREACVLVPQRVRRSQSLRHRWPISPGAQTQGAQTQPPLRAQKAVAQALSSVAMAEEVETRAKRGHPFFFANVLLFYALSAGVCYLTLRLFIGDNFDSI